MLIGRFTAILHAAARFVAPALDQRIAEAVQGCSIEAIVNSQRSIETVQSWMVVSAFNEMGRRGAESRCTSGRPLATTADGLTWDCYAV